MSADEAQAYGLIDTVLRSENRNGAAPLSDSSGS
jgi:ATP-dependent protease ClpP protease subunit